MDTLTGTIREILEYARLAPSVHNTQPWHFTIDNTTLQLFISEERILEAGDPTKRELWISLGCCIEAVYTAAAGLGYNVSTAQIQTKSPKIPIASFTFEKGAASDSILLDLLKKRHSYRGKMIDATIPEEVIASCHTSIADIKGVSLYVMQSSAHIQRVAEYTLKAMAGALTNPDFRKELSNLINYNWTHTSLGMHGYVLNKGVLGSVWERFSIRHGFDIKNKARADQHKVLDASALFFIATDGDTPPYWLSAGRAYLRTVLEVTKAGLAHSTLAAPIEAPGFHEDIEELLNSKQRLQTMIRVGKALKQGKRFSPRLSVDELTT